MPALIAPLIGILIGFVMCIPIGPLNLWVINTQIKKSHSRALALALGGSAMDFVYFYFILSGLSFINFQDRLLFYLNLLGIALIFALGIKELVGKIEIKKKEDFQNAPKDLLTAFGVGVLIYTSNPTLILTMTGLGTFVKSLQMFEFNQINILLISFGLAIGSFMWFFFLVKAVGRFQHKISEKHLSYFNKISGILMIILALFLTMRIFI